MESRRVANLERNQRKLGEASEVLEAAELAVADALKPGEGVVAWAEGLSPAERFSLLRNRLSALSRDGGRHDDFGTVFSTDRPRPKIVEVQGENGPDLYALLFTVSTFPSGGNSLECSWTKITDSGPGFSFAEFVKDDYLSVPTSQRYSKAIDILTNLEWSLEEYDKSTTFAEFSDFAHLY